MMKNLKLVLFAGLAVASIVAWVVAIAFQKMFQNKNELVEANVNSHH